MSHNKRPTVSRRHLVRALLGRDIPAAPSSDRDQAVSAHAAGDAAYAAGDYAGAVAAYRASVRGDLSNAAVRARLGHALYATGQFIQARVEFEHVLRLTGGNHALARLGLALTFLGLAKVERAAAALALFEDPERPELVAAAREAAVRLETAEAPDLNAARTQLEGAARALGLFPDTAPA